MLFMFMGLCNNLGNLLAFMDVYGSFQAFMDVSVNLLVWNFLDAHCGDHNEHL